MYIVGIDVVKKFHEATIIDRKGKAIIKRIRFANSHNGFLKLIDAIRKFGAPAKQRALSVAALRSISSSKTCNPTPCATCICARPKTTQLTL